MVSLFEAAENCRKKEETLKYENMQFMHQCNLKNYNISGFHCKKIPKIEKVKRKHTVRIDQIIILSTAHGSLVA